MAQLDDLKAALEASDAKVTEVAGKVDAVQADVQTLLDRLGSTTPPDLSEVVALAQGIQAKLGAVSEDLSSTPKPPAA